MRANVWTLMSALVRFLLQLNYGKSDKGRGGPHRLEGRPISYCLLHHCLRNKCNLTNLQNWWNSLRQPDFKCIHYFHIDHNSPCLPPLPTHKFCITNASDSSWSFLGRLSYPTEIAHNGYANFWRVNKMHYGLCENGEWQLRNNKQHNTTKKGTKTSMLRRAI